MHRRTAVPLFLAFAAVSLFGTACTPPCDAYCSAAADHIEFCLDNGSQGEWQSASWGTWNASDKAEYLSSCQTDMADQVSGVGDAEVLNSTCNDHAVTLSERTDFGLCAALP